MAGGQKKVKDSCVEEYTRINKNLLKSVVQPLFTVGKVSIPGLTSIGTMSLESRKCILTESLGVGDGFLNMFSEDLQLFVACLVLWCRNADPRITTGHLETVIAGVVLLRALASLAERKNVVEVVDDKNGRVEIGDKRKGEREAEVKEKDLGEQHRRKSNLKVVCGRKGELTEKGDDDVGNRETVNCFDSVMNQLTGYELKENNNTQLQNRKEEEKEDTVIGPLHTPSILAECSGTNLTETPIETGNVREAMDKEKSTFISLKVLCSQACIHDLESVRNNLNKYHSKSPTFNHNNHFNPSICHMFAQLQACMVDAINLNKLLRFPLPNIRPAELITGTFLYNFYVDISTRTNTDLFLATMLGRKSSIFSTFEQFRNVIVDFVGTEYFMTPASLSKKSRKKKSKSKVKEAPSGDIREENTHDKETTLRTIPGFDVANMFSVLSIDD